VTATVFADPALTGTRATVWLTGKRPRAELMARLAAVDPHEACCFTWRERGRVRALCFNDGVRVRFCGHGLLACAAARWQVDGPVQAMDSGAAVYPVQREAPDFFWLATSRIRCLTEALPPRDWFDIAPQSAALAGGDAGYWILRWPLGFDLVRLRPGLDAICRSTHRAVIATAEAGRGADHDIVVRYFAPQYGKEEDTATGSAAAVLGAFWNRPALVALQLPGDRIRRDGDRRRGGRIRVHTAGEEIRIGGTVTLDTQVVAGCTLGRSEVDTA